MKQKAISIPRILGVVLALTLLLAIGIASLSGSGYSRYRTQVLIANEVTRSNKLAGSFQLLDRPVFRSADGSVHLDESKDAQPTSGGQYLAIPGAAIPASPYIVIRDKTETPAYLYVEVCNGSRDVTAALTGDWSPLTSGDRQITGPHQGQIYVYRDGAVLSAEPEGQISVFKAVSVKTGVLSSEDAQLSVYAYMIQKTGDAGAQEAFLSAVESPEAEP